MTKKLKVLNLYAGIGGNRKLWKNVDVTAVEYNEEIAGIYQDFFPDDKVIVADAHKYLLEHYDDGWDFIWASPPCPTHSRIRNIAGVGRGQNKPVYPDMKLYQEIIFLQNIYYSSGCNFRGGYCIENVISYYEPLIKPQKRNRHYFWTNFHIPEINIKPLPEKDRGDIKGLQDYYGMKVSDIDGKNRTMLRNCVNPKLGNHILECARAKIENRKIKAKQKDLFI